VVDVNNNMCGGDSIVGVTSKGCHKESLAYSKSHPKAKGHGTLSVNDSPKAMGDSADEASSMKTLTSGSRNKLSLWKSLSHEALLGHSEGPLTLRLSNPDKPTELSDQVELSRCWKLEIGEQIVDVRGRLKGSIDFWQQTLKPAPWILDCINVGYKLPFIAVPDPWKNQDSALKNSEIVAEALRELEANQCIEKVDAQPHICSSLCAVDNGKGKLRLAINLRYLRK